MIIKIICGYPFPIGLSATNRIISYSKGLTEFGNDVEVIICCPTEKKSNVINVRTSGNYLGIKFAYSWYNTIWPSNYFMKIITSALSLIYSLLIVMKESMLEKIDIILSSYDSGVVNLLYFIITKLTGSNFVYIVDEYPKPIRYGKEPSLLRRFSINYSHLLFDGIIVMTNTLKTYFDDKVKRETKFLVMPMTVEMERFYNHNFPPPVKGKYIAYIGELSGNKDGVENLIEIFRMISEEFTELKLIIIGSAKTVGENEKLIKTICSYNLDGRIILTGRIHRDLVPAYLNNALVLALARPYTIRAQGGFPTKLGEYLASGRPVVCTAVGEIPDYLTDGLNAFLVEADNNKRFAQKLKYVLSNPELANNVGNEGRKIALNIFNYKVQSKRMNDFLIDLICRKTAPA